MKVNPFHWKELLDFAETNPDIITLKWGKNKDREVLLSLWKEITVKLNSMGMGIKSEKQWRKAFAAWKLKVKGKQSALLEQLKCGETIKPLSVNEKRLLQLLGFTKIIYSEKNKVIPNNEQEELEVKTESLLFEEINCNENCSIKREFSEEETEIASVSKKPCRMILESVNAIPIEPASLDAIHNSSQTKKPPDNDRERYSAKSKNISPDLESDSDASNNADDDNDMLQFNEMHEETLAVLSNIASSLESIAGSFKKIEENRTSKKS